MIFKLFSNRALPTEMHPHMVKRIRIIILVLIFGMTANASSNNLIFDGRAVAVGSDLSFIIINGFVHADVLVQTSKSEISDANIIMIGLSVHEYEWDQWLSNIKSIKRFNVKPSTINEKEVLKYFPERDENGKTIPGSFPFWKILPGTKSEEIPFGKKVPLYESLDWPVMPFL